MTSRVPIGDEQAPTLFGERLTCPMCGEAHTLPIPATVTGAHYGIPTQYGGARQAGGVIRAGLEWGEAVAKRNAATAHNGNVAYFKKRQRTGS
jgi:hypothetical protein